MVKTHVKLISMVFRGTLCFLLLTMYVVDHKSYAAQSLWEDEDTPHPPISTDLFDYREFLMKRWYIDRWNPGDVASPHIELHIFDIDSGLIEGEFTWWPPNAIFFEENGWDTRPIAFSGAVFANVADLVLTNKDGDQAGARLEFGERAITVALDSGKIYSFVPFNLSHMIARSESYTHENRRPIQIHLFDIDVPAIGGDLQVAAVTTVDNRLHSSAYLVNEYGDSLSTVFISSIDGMDIDDIVVTDLNGDGLDDIIIFAWFPYVFFQTEDGLFVAGYFNQHAFKHFEGFSLRARLLSLYTHLAFAVYQTD